MRIKLAHIALILSILALAVSLFTAVQVSQNDDDALIDALMAQNQRLQEQIDALSGQSVAVPEVPAQQAAAALTAVNWEDNQGADVILTLEGNADDEALLRVMLGSQVIAEVPCQWDGSVLTATASVPADNGYTYSVIVGSEARTLSSPEKPVYPALVYLADALNAYCNLVVGDWYVRDRILTVEDCYAHIHTPQMGTVEGVTCSAARMVLKYGEEVLAEYPISPVPGEEAGSYVCSINGAAFRLPELEEGRQMDLWLEATLSDGQVLTACAATWHVMPGGFSMAAG